MNRTAWRPALGLGLWWLLPAACAQAHLVNTQCGPFYNGLCHPLVTPTDLMSVLALSLLAGHAGPAAGRTTLFALTLSWLAGTVAGHTWLDGSRSLPPAGAAGANLIVALLVTANLRCPAWCLGLLATACGLASGLANGAEFARVPDAPLALAGNVVCVFAITAWVTALAVRNDHGWRRIVIRVVGSWLAAASLLLLGWELRSFLAE